METVHAMCIIADHPVPERLAVHAGRLRSFLPAHARKRISDREQAPRHARVGLSLGELAQRRWSPIPSYGQRRHDAFSESRRIGNHDPAHRVIRRSATGVILSVRRYDKALKSDSIGKPTADAGGFKGCARFGML